MSLNFGRQMGVQLSADLKLVEASTRFMMRWMSVRVGWVGEQQKRGGGGGGGEGERKP